MMLQGHKVHEPPKPLSGDRNQLQPHFDVNRFGSATPTARRTKDASDRSTNSVRNPMDASGLLSLVSDILLSTDALTCLRVAGDGLRQRLGASYVIVASSADGIAIDEVMPIGVPAAVEQLELREAIHAALLETMLTGRVHQGVVASSFEPSASTGCGYAIQRLANQLHGCASFMALPLFTSAGRCVGSIFVAWAQSDGMSGREESLKDHRWVNSIADVLQSKVHPQQRLGKSIAIAVQRRLPVRRSLWLTVLGASLIVIGMLPTAYPVRAKVVVEPDERRWISAPFDAPLKKSHVVPGDQVAVGQLLYSLDCQDLLNKLSSLGAEADKHTAERTTYLSTARLADAAISSANLKRVESEIALIYRYLDRSEIRSPVDGVVMGQDMQQYEGSPLKQGQGLVEIAPLSALHLKAEIPTDQITKVVSGNSASVSIESIGTLEPSQLARIHPCAEANEQGHYVFEGRIDLTGDTKGLMPGMSGYATLHGEPKPLAWCLFQQLWQRVQAWSEAT